MERIHSSLYYNPARYVTDELVETQPNQLNVSDYPGQRCEFALSLNPIFEIKLVLGVTHIPLFIETQ